MILPGSTTGSATLSSIPYDPRAATQALTQLRAARLTIEAGMVARARLREAAVAGWRGGHRIAFDRGDADVERAARLVLAELSVAERKLLDRLAAVREANHLRAAANRVGS